MFDTLIKNGKLIDGSKIEVAIEKGMIKAVATEINQPAQEVVDLEESIIYPLGGSMIMSTAMKR